MSNSPHQSKRVVFRGHRENSPLWTLGGLGILAFWFADLTALNPAALPLIVGVSILLGMGYLTIGGSFIAPRLVLDDEGMSLSNRGKLAWQDISEVAPSPDGGSLWLFIFVMRFCHAFADR